MTTRLQPQGGHGMRAMRAIQQDGWLLQHRLGRQDPGSSQEVRVCSETRVPKCLSSAWPAPATSGTGIPSPSTAGILTAPQCVEHATHPPCTGARCPGTSRCGQWQLQSPSRRAVGSSDWITSVTTVFGKTKIISGPVIFSRGPGLSWGGGTVQCPSVCPRSLSGLLLHLNAGGTSERAGRECVRGLTG